MMTLSSPGSSGWNARDSDSSEKRHLDSIRFDSLTSPLCYPSSSIFSMHICTRTIFASLSHTLLSTHPKLFRPATSFSFPMSHSSNSSSTNKPQHEVDTAKETGNTPRPQLTLPAPEDVAQDGHQLEVNGKDVKLDALGPVGRNSWFARKPSSH